MELNMQLVYEFSLCNLCQKVHFVVSSSYQHA